MVSPEGYVSGSQAPPQTPLNFGGQTNFSQLPTPQPDQMDFDPTARMRELYTPETMAGDRYNQLMQGRPEYEKPGVWRSIAAGLSAFGPGGHDIGMKVANFHNDRRLQEWTQNLDAAAKAAQLENTSNINARTMAHQTVQNEVALRRNEATAEHNRRRDEIAADRAAVYRLKNSNPNYKFNFDGPTVLVSDPTTGRTWNSGIQTGNLDDRTKIDLGQQNALERIDAQTAGRLEVVGEQGKIQGGRAYGQPIEIRRPDGTVEYYQPTVAEPPRKIETPPGSTVSKVGTGDTGGGELPTQTTRRHYNNAMKFKAQNPELGRWIVPGRGNTFKIVDPAKPGMFGSWLSRPGPTVEEHRKISDAIYGNFQGPPVGGGNTVTPTQQTQQTAPQVPAGAKPGGKWQDTKYGKVYIEP